MRFALHANITRTSISTVSHFDVSTGRVTTSFAGREEGAVVAGPEGEDLVKANMVWHPGYSHGTYAS